ncbi:MAG: putative beta-lysine N-acetyltransferase [Draconibacterium sp.]
MNDKIEKLGNSIIQHGKYNNRIYVMKFNPLDMPWLIPEIDEMALKNGYTKIFVKVPANFVPDFILHGYAIEGSIPLFFNSKTDCFFVSKFLDEQRKKIPENELAGFVSLLSTSLNNNNNSLFEYEIGKLGIEDSEAISEIFKQIFETYPFPVHKASYIEKTMNDNTTWYFGVKNGARLIGVSSAEIDLNYQNAEMTDFAVLPEYRGKKIAYHLLKRMEREMKSIQIKTLYTIARLKEPGMNKTFIKSGYSYSGTLLNNTNISGNIESMNIFYKHI